MGENGEKRCTVGVPDTVNADAFVELSTKRLLWLVNKLVFATAVKGVVLGVKADV